MTTITTDLPAPLAAEGGDHALSQRMRLLGLTGPARPRSDSLLDRLWAGCPRRALNWHEAEQVAERQAAALSRELGLADRQAPGRRLGQPAVPRRHLPRWLSDVWHGHLNRSWMGGDYQGG